MTNYGRFFTIVENEFVAAQLERECNEYTRFRTLYESIIWRLVRDPECGTKLDNGYYAVKTPFWGPSEKPASITVLYKIEPVETVVIYSYKIDWGKSR